MRALAVLLATGIYVGYIPFAPGTAGSLLGLIMVTAARSVGVWGLEIGCLVASVFIGVWSAGVAERHFQRKDPGPIVIDEVVGMGITLLGIPVSWPGMVVGFLAFRFFDVVKPFPARWAERLPGGWGVVTDDVVAALYGNIVVRVFGWALPTLMLSAARS